MEWIVIALGVWTALKVANLWTGGAQMGGHYWSDREDPMFTPRFDAGSEPVTGGSWLFTSKLEDDLNTATPELGLNVYGMSNSNDAFDDINSASGCHINPATGLPMVDDTCGADVGGNPYGFSNDDLMHTSSASSSFDDSWSSSSAGSDSFSSCSGMDWD